MGGKIASMPSYCARLIAFLSTATAILDSCGRIIAVLAGRPDDPSWDSVHLEAVELLEKTRPLLRLSKKSKRHRRGNFAALSYGISHGGGQTKPSNLKQAGENEEHMSGVIRHESFERMSGFGSGPYSWRAYRVQTLK
jgi:hypothetical protein